MKTVKKSLLISLSLCLMAAPLSAVSITNIKKKVTTWYDDHEQEVLIGSGIAVAAIVTIGAIVFAIHCSRGGNGESDCLIQVGDSASLGSGHFGYPPSRGRALIP